MVAALKTDGRVRARARQRRRSDRTKENGMTDELRALAEAEARRRRLVYPDSKFFELGFIAGRTSVTQLEIERAIIGRTATAGARAVLALLNEGENDEV